MVRLLLALVIALHGLIHLLGPAKAFGWADVSQLHQPVTTRAGVAWLAATVLLVVAAFLVGIGARWWWLVALPGVVLSQWLIVGAWGDARFGTAANVIIFVPLVLAALDARPGSFHSMFVRETRAALATPLSPAPLVTDADLAALPPLVQTYLRRVGAVGRPRVRSFRAAFDAQMRGGPDKPWMKASVEQYEFFDPPARYFFMRAARSGVPFDVFHRYVGDSATMRVRVAGIVPVVDIKGRNITQSETVTLLNDVLVLAPAAVLGLPFSWETTGEHTVRATFTNAGHTVSAVLTFDAAGDLVGFVSNDRYQSDAKGDRNFPWSTPISGYALVNGIRVGTRGDADWIEPRGEWTYGRFVLTDLAYNVRD
jgi:hypothetical protein